MKRVNPEQLTRVALAKGASITVDGKAINASRERMDVPRLKLASPAPAPDLVEPAAAPTAPAQIDTAGLERAAQASQHSTQQLLQLVAMLVQEVRAGQQKAPRHGWNFEVQRDAAGRLTNIKARPLSEGE